MVSYISEYEPLDWLVAILYTHEFDDRNSLVSPYFYPVPDYTQFLGIFGRETTPPRFKTFEELYEAIVAFIQSNEKVCDFYNTAVQAIKDGEIEERVPQPDEWGEVSHWDDTSKVNAFEFLLWAEKKGQVIPHRMTKALELAAFTYTQAKHAKGNWKHQYPTITEDHVARLCKEPLWPIGKGVLYLFGHRSRSDKEAEFIKDNKTAQKLIEYMVDAAKTDLKDDLHDYIPDDANPDAILSAKIAPPRLIEWVKTLPIKMPPSPIFAETGANPIIPDITSNYTTPEIEMLRLVMEEFWSDHQAWGDEAYSKSETADAIIEWIKAEGKKRGMNISQNIAQAIQTIVRPLSCRGSGRK